MKIAIMQPYFLPYIGYWQLMGAVDLFVVYDRIKYTKKGWINRNRMLVNGSDAIFSLPLRKDSDQLDVVERELAPDFDRRKLLNQFAGAYRRAPFFEPTFALLERVIGHPGNNLFDYIHHSLLAARAHLGIETQVITSSSLAFDNSLRGQDKVLAICKALGATSYVNAIGGTELYDKAVFGSAGIKLQFLRSRPFEYGQFEHAFVPWLSIADVLMFNPPDLVRDAVGAHFDLI